MAQSRTRFLSIGLVLILLSLTLAPPAISLTGYRWYPIGPSPGPGLFPGDAAGRVTAIAVNPSNQDDVWIGTAGGGVWHWDFDRQKWFAMSDNEASLAIGSIALAGCDTSKCTTVYAGTGENAVRRDTYYGAGLLIGTYDGTSMTWVLKNGQPYDFTHGSIYNVVLDPGTSGAGQVIYIALSSGSTASSSESTVTAPVPLGGYGIYKSTNNGVTWSKLFPGRPTDLEMDPAHPHVLYAGLMGAGIFRSTDSGATWCPLNPGINQPVACNLQTFNSPLPNPLQTTFDHVEIALDPTLNQTKLHLYASFGMCPDRWDLPCSPGYYESTDGGDTWSLLFPGDTTFTFHLDSNGFPECPYGYSRYSHALTVDPSSPSTFFAGAVRLCKYDRNSHIFLPADSDTAIPTITGQLKIIHPDHHSVVFAHSDEMHQRVYDSNDGGVAISKDGGNSWTPMVQNLGVMEFQSLSDSGQTPDVFGGLQDNGALDWDGSKSWSLYPWVSDGGSSIMMPHGVVVGRYVTTAPRNYGSLDIHPLRSINGQSPFPEVNQYPPYDLGLNISQFRSFYPPYVANADTKQFFGTQWVYRSTDEATNWSLISPFLASGDPLAGAFPGAGTFPDVDTLTAITTHPSDSTHIYAGSYAGKLHYTTAACTSSTCWPAPTVAPPAAPITRLAVDSRVMFRDKVYATLSGFFPGMHVYGSSDGGDTWTQAAGHPDLDGVPINTITIDPAGMVHNNLWIGTDKGVYRSDNAGASWYRFSIGLPNVPVYEILIDGPRDRAFAATHGRGVYILTAPTIKQHAGTIKGNLTILSAMGTGFGSSQRCTLKVLRQDGSVCAVGSSDAFGGTLGTDADGFLVSSKAGVFTNLPVVSVCAQGKCLASDIKNCSLAGNPMTMLETSCGSQIVTTPITPAADGADPFSSVFTLSGLQGGALASVTGNADQESLKSDGLDAPVTGGTLQLLPAVQAMDGSTRLFCSVGVPFAGGDSTSAVLQRASDAVNGDAGCQASGVSAVFVPAIIPTGGEDEFAHPAALRLEAPGVTGGELITGVSTLPGQAAGICLDLSNIGDPSASKLHGMKVRFATPPAGAMGGSLTFTEQSGLGECSITVPLAPGAQPTDIALAVANAFQAPGIPGPNAGCISDSNPRDVVNALDSVTTSLASTLDICVNDSAVGVTLVPQEICSLNTDCNDGNPCTQDVCVASTGQCQSTAVPNGQPCDDSNPCTIGNTCQSGACGTPISCNDGNTCTQDSCNPATGACANTPKSCDDGNPCTLDSCNGATGACTFAPTPGATCNDGDSCTSGDSCVLNPGNPIPTCQGNPKCADGDPCTSDLCDPATGACINSPIQCDDGNSCTADTCTGGACVASPLAGACDDGNRCTVSDTCAPGPAGPVCSGTPVNCDDGNACTVDDCDPVSGGCTHAPVMEPDVTGLLFTSLTVVTWSANQGAGSYDSYRGTIPAHGLGTRPPAGPLYDQTCFETGDSNGDGVLVSTDPAIPPLGTAFYYLVSEVAACGQGPVGEDSNGTTIMNSSPCPGP